MKKINGFIFLVSGASALMFACSKGRMAIPPNPQVSESSIVPHDITQCPHINGTYSQDGQNKISNDVITDIDDKQMILRIKSETSSETFHIDGRGHKKTDGGTKMTYAGGCQNNSIGIKFSLDGKPGEIRYIAKANGFTYMLIKDQAVTTSEWNLQ